MSPHERHIFNDPYSPTSPLISYETVCHLDHTPSFGTGLTARSVAHGAGPGL
ncbi:hypothetical protein B0T14DRAFT_506225 [Immersiella caudata]|uniref:Uncharacterized protein n=1 Tax=Immersiella caudata TaxID=314043 RepID=A0AA40CCD6_9PEZI|nr:hypothetical protein B0T14DRAFT_506225 [Immersiella caudata]